jgi:hypothetical protein
MILALPLAFLPPFPPSTQMPLVSKARSPYHDIYYLSDLLIGDGDERNCANL